MKDLMIMEEINTKLAFTLYKITKNIRRGDAVSEKNETVETEVINNLSKNVSTQLHRDRKKE
jgi:hypothetical protein